jgi:GNAT superfamily N-acetyltransferase
MPSVNVRFAEKDDTPALIELIGEFAEYERSSHMLSVTEEKLEETLFGNKPSGEALIAGRKKDPVGFATFSETISVYAVRTLFLETINVTARVRGTGVGFALFRRLLDIAKTRGYGRLWGFDLDWNRSAIEFYLKAGAELRNDWKMFCIMPANIPAAVRGIISAAGK